MSAKFEHAFTRRLLCIDELCRKISMGKSTFHRRREEMERDGFPKPALKGGRGVPTRWDERAIDLYLDTLIDPGLLQRVAQTGAHKQAATAYDIASKLKSRAEGMSL